jgi:heme exporter protein C
MLSSTISASKINHFSKALIPILPLLIILSIIVSGYSILNSPLDYLQGESVRIMYIHVPSAWLSLGLYSVMAVLALGYVITRNTTLHYIGIAIAPVGAMLCGLCLVTGSIWGKPTWGTWWVWDARLTSMLILFFMYLGYISLYKGTKLNSHKAAINCSLIALVGLINIPIIKFSVEIWSTLHQPASIFKIGGPTVHTSMLYPLLFSTLSIFLLALLLILMRIRTLMNQLRLERLRILKDSS